MFYIQSSGVEDILSLTTTRRILITTGILEVMSFLRNNCLFPWGLFTLLVNGSHYKAADVDPEVESGLW